MPEIIYKNFEGVDQEIEKVGKDFEIRKNMEESKGVGDREILKQILHPLVKTPAPLPQANSKPQADLNLPAYLKDSPEEIKQRVEYLISETFKKGIERTANDAQKFGPFILDAYHDALTDKLYEELQRRKII